MKVIWFLLLVIMPAYAVSQAQKDNVRTFNAVQVTNDLQFLKTVLEKTHPSLCRYMSPKVWNNLFPFDDLKPGMIMDEITTYELMQNIVTAIGSGHTNLLPSKSSVDIYNAQTHDTFPILVYLQNNRAFVKKFIYIADTAFRVGDEILSINGESAFSVIKRLRNLVSGDGIANNFKDYRLEKGVFNQLYNLIYGDVKQFTITFRSNTAVKEKTIPAAHMNPAPLDTGNQLLQDGRTHLAIPFFGDDTLSNKMPGLRYAKNCKSTAILAISDFTYNDYLTFHQHLFKELAQTKTRNLIIDLRGNTGGYDRICIDLMKYLCQTAFYFSPGEVSATDISTAERILLNPNFKPGDTTKISFTPRTLINAENRLQHPYGNRFGGSTFIIVDGGTFSAASLFAQAVKDQGDHVLIYGRETGGSRAGSDGGKLLHLVLPQTRFQLTVPLLYARSTSLKHDEGRGIIPDFDCPRTAMDVYNTLKHISDVDVAAIEVKINNP